VTAVLWHLFDWPTGSVLTNLIASAIWVIPTYMLALRHLHCIERGCYRPATVPVKNTPHKRCKRHATVHGDVHC
jgi:hypothetical protein